MFPTIVHEDADKISSRLRAMGLERRPIRDAVDQGRVARSSLTAHHPRILHGLVMWGETVAALRDFLAPYGYEKLERGNYELTTHAELGIAIAVASGDAGTGIATVQPANKCPKGINTVQAIEANRQLDMFVDLLPEVKPDGLGLETWVLLHYIAENQVRMELSRPSEIDADGIIYGWTERIILDPIDLDDNDVRVDPPQMPDIDISIPRKTA